MIRGIIIGVLLTLAGLAISGYVGINEGMMPANADARPGKLERWAAGTSLHVSVAREAPKTPNPLPIDDANLLAGIKLYGQNCIVCHGVDVTGKMGPYVGRQGRGLQTDADGPRDVCYSGGADGAVQSFHRHGTKQDEMLRIIAYVRTLDK